MANQRISTLAEALQASFDEARVITMGHPPYQIVHTNKRKKSSRPSLSLGPATPLCWREQELEIRPRRLMPAARCHERSGRRSLAHAATVLSLTRLIFLSSALAAAALLNCCCSLLSSLLSLLSPLSSLLSPLSSLSFLPTLSKDLKMEFIKFDQEETGK